MSRRSVVAVGLLLMGFLSLGLWRVISGSEHQAFAKGATPAESYRVTSGHQYSLAVPGGVPALLKHGLPEVSGKFGTTIGLTCEWSSNGSGEQALTVNPEMIGTKAETDVATFTSPLTGDISVTCDGWGRMFIPDSDDSSSDPSGYFLLLSIITLTIGGALGLGAAYQGSVQRRAEWAARDAEDAAQ